MNVLLIGCGNIGALYDLHNDYVQTYAKALSLQESWQVSVFDTDRELAEKVAGKYGFRVMPAVDHYDYEIVCIATPTQHHSFYLQAALEAGVPFIFCEKPVSYKLSELDEVERLYHNGNSKVIVNYIRRFQPAYEKVRGVLSFTRSSLRLRQIVLRYRRGLLNNGTHGLDLIEFLTHKKLDFSKAIIHTKDHDAFENDPTISCTLRQRGFVVELESVAGTDFPVFELLMTWEDQKIHFTSGGDTIDVYTEETLIHEERNALRNYMEAVISLPEKMLADQKINDNFMESTDLNRRVLEWMKTL